MKVSQEVLAMQGLWRRALAREEGLSVALPTKSDATRMRFALYNAVRGVRKGDIVDPELLRATEELAVRVGVDGKGKPCVTFVKKSNGVLLAAALDALGGDLPAPAPTAEEVALGGVAERLSALSKEVSGEAAPAEPARVTPYYKRS